MKIRSDWSFLIAALLIAARIANAVDTNELSNTLAKGLFEEEANHNLGAAIQMYQSVIDRFDTDRKLAATAIFRLGECYRKQGSTNEALGQYQRVIREFSDQTSLVTLSRQYQASLGGPAPALPGPSPAVAAENTSNVGDLTEISRVLAIIKNSPDLINAPDGGRTLMQSYAAKDNIEVVKLLLNNGAAVNGIRQQELTALHFAAVNGHKAMVDLLLNKGAKVDAATDDGITPLHLAVLQGYELVARDLLDAGASVNAKILRDDSRTSDQYMRYSFQAGQTPLHVACSKGYDRLVNLLIAKGADVNLEDGEGHTPLGVAAQARNVEIAKTLLAAHADPNRGKSPALIAAASNGNLPMLSLLLSNGADPNRIQPAPGVMTPLQIAVATKHPEVVKELLAHKADASVRFQDGSGSTLVVAALSDIPTLQALLDGGADPNLTSSVTGQSPLIEVLRSSYSNYPQLLEILLSHGANPKIADSSGLTPLHFAAIYGEEPAVEPLIKMGAVVNAQQQDGETPLHEAVRKRNKKIATVLLDHGADPNIRDKNGETALEIASQRGPLPAPPPFRPGLPGLPGLPTPGFGAQPAATQQAMRELLLAHGAIEDLPRMNQIEVRRGTGYDEKVFTRYTNDVNRFTILELLAAHYGFVSATSGGRDNSPRYYDGLNRTLQSSLRFPNLDEITIRRPQPDGKSWTSIPVQVQKDLDSGECSRVWLEWGDQVEILEADHPLSSAWKGFSDQVFTNLQNCLKRQIHVIVKGKTMDIILQIARPTNPLTPPSIEFSPPSFYLARALENSGLLRTSSDLSHVKVIRHNSATRENWERTFDCSSEATSEPSLWLRDGDTIEVPDKP